MAMGALCRRIDKSVVILNLFLGFDYGFDSRKHPPHHVKIARLDLTLTASHRQNDNNADPSYLGGPELQDRRSFVALLTGSMTYCRDAAVGYDGYDYYLQKSGDTENDAEPITVTLPLEPASGGTFSVRIRLLPFEEGARNDEPFHLYRAIVDTGSPYLVLPSSGSSKRNARNDDRTATWLSNSNYTPTEEVYGSVKGLINWKYARYAFRDPHLRTINAEGVVGVLDDVLTKEATGGGMIEPYALIGLIRNHNPQADRCRFPFPRPTFLEQESISFDNNEHQIKSFTIDGPCRELTLSSQSLISPIDPVLPLVDLRVYGDFVDHYAVMIESISFDSVLVTSSSLERFSGGNSKNERPIVGVFDTGLTSCLMIRPFWEVVSKFLEAQGTTADSITLISLSLKQIGGGKMKQVVTPCNISSSIRADPRFYVKPIDLDWFDDEQNSPYVIVLGQSFLSQAALTIDLETREATFNLATA
jgi:hypothetical protein